MLEAERVNIRSRDTWVSSASSQNAGQNKRRNRSAGVEFAVGIGRRRGQAETSLRHGGKRPHRTGRHPEGQGRGSQKPIGTAINEFLTVLSSRAANASAFNAIRTRRTESFGDVDHRWNHVAGFSLAHRLVSEFGVGGRNASNASDRFDAPDCHPRALRRIPDHTGGRRDRLILSNLRHQATEQGKQQLLATATVLSRQAARDFQAIDLIEANLIEYMETLAIVSDELYARAMVGRGIHLMLKDKISGFPHIGAVMLVGADGQLINSSQVWPTPPLNFAGQDYFDVLKANPRLSSMLGRPVQDRQTGVWTMYFAHKFRGSNGEFLGLVVGTVASQYFEDSFETLARGTDESTTLLRDDGVVLARHPHIDSIFRKSFARNLPDGTAQRSGGDVAQQRDMADDSERLIAEARLPNIPINLTTSTTVAAALADWRTEAGYLIGLTIVLVVAIGGTGAVLVQFFRRQSIQLDSTLNNLSQGVCMYDEHRRLILCNDRYIEMFQLPHELTTPGTPLRHIFDHQVSNGLHPGSDPDEHFRDMMAVITAREPASNVTEFADGRAMVAVFRPAPGGGFVTTVEDITEQRRAEKRIAHIAHHDSLTGLHNRAAFSDYLAKTIDESLRTAGTFAILCLDLDRFKEVNDLYGHLVGDALLREVARRLQAVAEGAFLARIGGDEFIVITVGETQAAAVGQLAQQLRTALSGDIEIAGRQLHVGLSIGIASCPVDGTDPTTLLANADVALYRAKAEGRDTIRFFETDMAAQLRDRRELQHDLQSALTNDELWLDFQPLARSSGDIVGFEALVRWRHPKRGMVAPGVFIPLAEENGLIVAMGEWILRAACREAAS